MEKLNFDGQLAIATGASRKETHWKNKQILWSELVTRMTREHRTAETVAEYAKAKRARQDEIKDVGGFVGGFLTGGKRKAESVLNRSVLTLDLDFAVGDFWGTFTMIYDNAACVYSTHKHSRESPRLRLVMPLSREVDPTEYMAIARRIAGVLGIEQFDTTTYQPSRLMYWPSTSKDGEWYCQWQDGEWLDADKVLASYTRWQDSSEWPTGERESAVVVTAIKKAEDPLEKRGVVGAFCRTYGIEEAIDRYLGDVYEKCSVVGENRWTFIGGSTAAGLVVYENKWAYSHHGTDPVSGKLCNAFDLVRLHKYGLRDPEEYEGDVVKLPSFGAMSELATNDEDVRLAMAEEQMAGAREAFEGVEGDEGMEVGEEGLVDNEWKKKLLFNRQGKLENTIGNYETILMYDPIFKGKIGFDNMLQKGVILAPKVAWRRDKITKRTSDITDRDGALIENLIEKKYKFSGPKLEKAFQAVYNVTEFHPVQTYLRGLKWDGRERLDKMLVEYMGAADDIYVRAVTRKTFTAAVARVFEPGIKFDCILTLVGPQGAKKSSLFDKMGGDWFNDSFHFDMLKNKEGFEQLRGMWIIEIAELANLRKSSIENVKAFVASKSDNFRPAYGKHTQQFYRQSIFVATTNDTEFLIDQTGNRRFWPVVVYPEFVVKDVFDDLPGERDQLWAEAVVRYDQDEELFLRDDVETLAQTVQEEHIEVDPWVDKIMGYLGRKLPETWAKMNRYEQWDFLSSDEVGAVERDRVCVDEIWENAFRETGAIDQRSDSRIRTIMRKLVKEGWRKSTGVIRFGRFGSIRRGFVNSFYPADTPKLH